jgi:hypothetical protein
VKPAKKIPRGLNFEKATSPADEVQRRFGETVGSSLSLESVRQVNNSNDVRESVWI